VREIVAHAGALYRQRHGGCIAGSTGESGEAEGGGGERGGETVAAVHAAVSGPGVPVVERAITKAKPRRITRVLLRRCRRLRNRCCMCSQRPMNGTANEPTISHDEVRIR